MAAMQRIVKDNLPNVAVHGTSIHSAEAIVKRGMTPGGGSRKRQANHFACTLPNDVSTVVSGYRATSQVCIFLDLARWIKDGQQAFKSPNEVICIFQVNTTTVLLGGGGCHEWL